MGWRGWRVDACSQSDFMLFLPTSHRSILSWRARPSGSEQTRRLLEVTLHIQSNDLKKRTRTVSRVSSLHQSQLRFKCVRARQRIMGKNNHKWFDYLTIHGTCLHQQDRRIGANCICCYIYSATRGWNHNISTVVEMTGFKILVRLNNLITAKLLVYCLEKQLCG